MNEVVLQNFGLCVFVLILLTVIKLNSLKWAGFVVRMRDNRNIRRVLVGKAEGRRRFVRLRLRSKIFFFAVALRPNTGHGLLILEVSRSHTTTHHSR